MTSSPTRPTSARAKTACRSCCAASCTRSTSRTSGSGACARRRRSQARPRGEFQLKAPMPGLIVAVPVTEGETVSHGQNLVILESMKMQNELQARPATASSSACAGESRRARRAEPGPGHRGLRWIRRRPKSKRSSPSPISADPRSAASPAARLVVRPQPRSQSALRRTDGRLQQAGHVLRLRQESRHPPDVQEPRAQDREHRVELEVDIDPRRGWATTARGAGLSRLLRL